jgi:hypothetical protein
MDQRGGNWHPRQQGGSNDYHEKRESDQPRCAVLANPTHKPFQLFKYSGAVPKQRESQQNHDDPEEHFQKQQPPAGGGFQTPIQTRK